jgi:ubiquitin C-terminal hydrolase
MGATCYLNAVLQALAALRPLLRALDSSGPLPELTASLREVLREVVGAPGPALRPSALLKLMAEHQGLGGGALRTMHMQHDAHEVLVLLVDVMVTETPAAPMRRLDAPPSQRADGLVGLLREAWRSADPRASRVFEALHGQTVSRVACERCSYRSAHAAAFLTLTVYPKTGEDLAASIEGALEDERVGCERCGPGACVMRTRLSRLPPALIVHVQRCTSAQGGKRAEEVAVPEDLDLCRLVLGGGLRLARTRYVIRSAILHHGCHASSGHYTCVVRGRDGCWSWVDDAVVSRMDHPRAVAALRSATLLSYEAAP